MSVLTKNLWIDRKSYNDTSGSMKNLEKKSSKSRKGTKHQKLKQSLCILHLINYLLSTYLTCVWQQARYYVYIMMSENTQHFPFHGASSKVGEKQ